MPSGTSVSGFWRATKTQTGQHYKFVNLSYNGDIAPGQEENFGFNAAGLGKPASLTVRQ